jgi:hypothetical protein
MMCALPVLRAHRERDDRGNASVARSAVRGRAGRGSGGRAGRHRWNSPYGLLGVKPPGLASPMGDLF